MVRLKEKVCVAVSLVYGTNVKYYPLENSKPNFLKLYLMLTSVEIFARVSISPNR